MARTHKIPVKQGNLVGSTAFFRNDPLYETIADLILERGRTSMNVLIHACSIGAEVYSFVAFLKQKGLLDKIDIRVTATDISPQMVSYACAGNYPADLSQYFTDEEKSHFVINPANSTQMKVKPDIAEKITFIDPISFVDYTTEQNFDIVFISNALIYVNREQQSETIRKVSSYNDFLFICTGFYLDTIKQDISDNAYEPIQTNIESIHNGWKDRIANEEEFKKKFGMELHESEEFRAFIPRFSKVEDFEYKYCSIFRKKTAAQ